MKRPFNAGSKNTKTKSRLTKDAARLVNACKAAIDSASRSEEQYWFDTIETLASELMDRGNDIAIEAALEHTHHLNSAAHEILAASCEAAAESCCYDFEKNGGGALTHQALLVSLPIIAWSKYQIPSGLLSDHAIAPIRAQLYGHILCEDVSLGLNPFLYSIDQLPHGFADTRKLLKTMADAVKKGQAAAIDYAKLGDAAELPADARFILGVVIFRRGAAFFQWQEFDGKGDSRTRAECLERLNAQLRPQLATMMPGCEFESGLPNAFFNNCRESDLQVRPHTLDSVISGMATLLDTTTSKMAAVVAGVGNGQIDEYRVSITRQGQDNVLNGVVWPLYGEEDDDTNPSPRQTIEALLKNHKLGDITLLEGILPPEYCDDCGAPLFYTHDGEAVHAEMPEDIDHPATHYH